MPKITDKPQARGGTRKNAGAPPKDPQLVRVKYHVRIPQWMAQQLDDMCLEAGITRTDAVETALRHIYRKHLSRPQSE